MRIVIHRLVVLSILATVLALAAPAAMAGNGGNSLAAHACQRGGYQHLFRSDGSGFRNVGDCVSYVAHGGRFLMAGSSPSLTIAFDVATTSYVATVTGSDLRPGSTVWFYVYTSATSSTQQLGTVAADGTFSGRTHTFSCGSVVSMKASGTAADGTSTISPLMNAPC